MSNDAGFSSLCYMLHESDYCYYEYDVLDMNLELYKEMIGKIKSQNLPLNTLNSLLIVSHKNQDSFCVQKNCL